MWGKGKKKKKKEFSADKDRTQAKNPLDEIRKMEQAGRTQQIRTLCAYTLEEAIPAGWGAGRFIECPSSRPPIYTMLIPACTQPSRRKVQEQEDERGKAHPEATPPEA